MKNNAFKYFLLTIIILTMYNNLEHSASIYYKLIEYNGYSELYNRLQAYLVVVVIDLLVIAFIMHSKTTESKVFAWLLFLVNMLFFDASTTLYNLVVSEYPTDRIAYLNTLMAQLAFSGIFSYSLYRVSLLYHQTIGQQSTMEQLQAQIKQEKAYSEQLKAKSEQQQAIIVRLNEDKEQQVSIIEQHESKIALLDEQLTVYIKPLTCNCGFVGKNEKSLNAHKGWCKNLNNAIGA